MQERIYTYEGLFLFPQAAVADLQAASDHVMELLNRAGAEVISFKKWDERRLAYEVKGNKRGLYFLVYFKAKGSKLAGLERDCSLSEKMLRATQPAAATAPAQQETATAVADEDDFNEEE